MNGAGGMCEGVTWKVAGLAVALQDMEVVRVALAMVQIS